MYSGGQNIRLDLYVMENIPHNFISLGILREI